MKCLYSKGIISFCFNCICVLKLCEKSVGEKSLYLTTKKPYTYCLANLKSFTSFFLFFFNPHKQQNLAETKLKSVTTWLSIWMSDSNGMKLWWNKYEFYHFVWLVCFWKIISQEIKSFVIICQSFTGNFLRDCFQTTDACSVT